MWFVHANLLNERLTSVRTLDPLWGDWHNSSAEFSANHNHVNAAPKQASIQTILRPHHNTTPKQNYCMSNVLVSITNCEIKNQKSGVASQYLNSSLLITWKLPNMLTKISISILNVRVKHVSTLHSVSLAWKPTQGKSQYYRGHLGLPTLYGFAILCRRTRYFIAVYTREN